jgi:hypothetical protein
VGQQVNGLYASCASSRRAKQPFASLTTTHAVFHGGVRDADYVGYVCHRQSLAVENKIDRVAAVPPLLTSSCPAAIAWFIVSVYVDPVDTVLRRRARTHVGIEIGKRLPSFTNRDASPAVVGILHQARVAAPVAHLGPDRILGALAQAVSRVYSRSDLAQQTPTRPQSPSTQVPAVDNFLSAAIAADVPSDESALMAGAIKNKQSIKPSPAKINQPAVIAGSICISHMP